MGKRTTHEEDSVLAEARAAICSLIEFREPGATVCSSEAARRIAASRRDFAPEAWREFMPAVHATVDELLKDETIWLTWKGKRLTGRNGPYRINRKVTD